MVDRGNQRLNRWRNSGMILLCCGIVLLATGCSMPSTAVEPAAVIAAARPSAQVDGGAYTLSPSVEQAEEVAVAVSVPTQYGYEIVNRYPHDPSAFTQGLVYEDGMFYEGTGLYGQSTLRKVDPSSGEVLFGVRLPDDLFGEGVTVLGDKVYQLTWKAQIGMVADRESFELIETFTYPTEGWGLTHDGERLIMSDGTDSLTFLDPDSLEQVGSIQVFDDTGPVLRLNELEYVDGEVYANVWQTDRIARIDPGTGQVTAWIDLSGLLSAEEAASPIGVLNGIAYDEKEDRLFVTGKFWPTVFEIRLIERSK